MTSGEAVDYLDGRVTAQIPAQVTFLNAHTAVLAKHIQAFETALQSFVVLNDGIGIDIASLFKYGKVCPDNLNGTDFIPYYLRKTKNSFRIFLLGAQAGVVAKAAQKMASDFPRHQIVGFCDGYSYRDKNITSLIREKQANLILVGMGNPLQELWIAENLPNSGAKIGISVGGFFDFEAGCVPRAPALLRKLRSEWMFRLWCEPKRLWRRYLIGNFVFIFYAMIDAIHYRIKK
jgi:alpha-1,3-mannosyltransferase